MTDERYVIRTERLADAHGAFAPVWRSRYDGPYTGFPADPALASYEKTMAAAHGADEIGIWQGGAGLAANLHDAWGAFAASGDPGWAPYNTSGRPAMIFGTRPGPNLEDDPFAVRRELWAGLNWQPGSWWSY
jgi:para-nitrobenzyl esterase